MRGTQVEFSVCDLSFIFLRSVTDLIFSLFYVYCNDDVLLVWSLVDLGCSSPLFGM